MQNEPSLAERQDLHIVRQEAPVAPRPKLARPFLQSETSLDTYRSLNQSVEDFFSPSQRASPSGGPTFIQPRSTQPSPSPSVRLAAPLKMEGDVKHSPEFSPESLSEKRGSHRINHANVFASAPWKLSKTSRGNASLSNAIQLAGSRTSLQYSWVGTLGLPSDAIPEGVRTKISNAAMQKDCFPVFVNDATFAGHYRSFCKQILWPTLHYQVPDNPKSKAFEDHSWTHYQRLNQIFADRVVEQYKEGDVVWVHDYHLMLVPQMVREKIPNAEIGFFLHVSFPSSEVFRCFAQRSILLRGMLGANSVGFQTEEYVRHFVQTCNRLLLADFTKEGVHIEGRTVNVTHSPVGIDADSLAIQCKGHDVKNWQDRIRERWSNKRLIVSRDQLDALRGVKQKLLAFEKLLDRCPQYAQSARLILLSPRSASGDRALEVEILSLMERINSRLADIAADPLVVYLNQEVEFSQYLALLKEADAFVVGSMREGMNLSCHEFVVATSDKHSALVLSEFTGSASIFSKGAVLINPWDVSQQAKALEYALTMPKTTRDQNWTHLYASVRKYNSQKWIDECLHAIDVSQTVPSCEISNKPYLTLSTLSKCVSLGENRILLLSLEKITAPVVLGSSKFSTADIATVLSILARFCAEEKMSVFVVSSYSKTDLNLKYGHIDNLGLIAENGGFVKMPKEQDFLQLGSTSMTWIEALVPFVKDLVERLPGSCIEVSDSLVRFNAENSSPEDAHHKMALIAECVTHVNDLFAKDDIHATVVNDKVVIQQATIPGNALNHVLESVPRVDLLMVCGGPLDEHLFDLANRFSEEKRMENLVTVQIGRGKNTPAQQCIEGVNEFFSLLAKV